MIVKQNDNPLHKNGNYIKVQRIIKTSNIKQVEIFIIPFHYIILVQLFLSQVACYTFLALFVLPHIIPHAYSSSDRSFISFFNTLLGLKPLLLNLSKDSNHSCLMCRIVWFQILPFRVFPIAHLIVLIFATFNLFMCFPFLLRFHCH